VWRQYLVEHVAVRGVVPTRQLADVTYRRERAGNI
jgi:hypothetical protein